jgi:hypothetical protein
MSGKFTVHVEAFKPRVASTLRGFCTITIPELRLRIHNVGVHEKGDARWIGLPAKPQIDRSGCVRKDERGKTLYVPILEFTDKATRDAFSARVIQSLLEFAPSAFSDEEAA